MRNEKEIQTYIEALREFKAEAKVTNMNHLIPIYDGKIAALEWVIGK